MEECLVQLRSEIEILNPFSRFSSEKKPKFTKTGRLSAVNALRDALSRKPVIAALTAVSRQEMVRGPTDEVNKLLGWAELSCVMFKTLEQVCTETQGSGNALRSRSSPMRPVYIDCFRSVLKLSLQHGPQGVLRHLVRPFLVRSHEWLAEPTLRAPLADQIWQCVREILQDDVNRALLLPPYIRSWVDACFEQLTGRGALRHPCSVVTNIAGEVLQILAASVESYDTLSQTSNRRSPSKMLGCDFGYAIIAERCCSMLIVADTMPRRNAREVQSVAFRTLATVLSDHALDVLGSTALKSIVHASLKPMLTCWSERKYHKSAVSFCKVLVLLDPSNKKLIDTIRHRILVDLKEESSSAIIRGGKEVSADYVDAAAVCFTFCGSLEFAGAPETRQGLVILWLRVAFAIISRRILKHGTNLLAEATDVLDQCSKAAVTVTEILKRHGNFQENDYLHIVRWCTLIVNVTAVIANNIHVGGAYSTSFAKSAWQDLYKELREQAMKAKYSVRSRGTSLTLDGTVVQAPDLILQTLGLLCGLEIVESATLAHSGTEGDVGSAPYPISRLMSTSGSNVTHYEIEYIRSLICRTGLLHDEGAHVRFQLVSTLLECCQGESGTSPLKPSILEEASASVLVLTRGESSLCDKSDLFQMSRTSEKSVSLIALHSFHDFFGLRSSCEKITGEGGQLVRSIVEQETVWSECSYWSPQGSIAANSAAQALNSSLNIASELSSLKSSICRHSSIDAKVTNSLEKKMFNKLREVLDKCIVTKRVESSAMGGESLGETDQGEQTNPRDAIVFPDSGSLAKCLQVVVFLSCYLCQGIRLGLIALSGDGDSTNEAAIEKLVQLLGDGISCAAKAKPEHLIHNYHLTQEAVERTARLFVLIDTEIAASSFTDTDNVWSQLARAVETGISCISRATSRLLFARLQRESENSVKAIKSLARDDFSEFSDVLGRSNARKRHRTEGRSPERTRKRRRSGSPMFSDESAKSDEETGSHRNPIPMVEPANNFEDDHSEDSDDFPEFAFCREEVGPVSEFETHSAVESQMSFWQMASSILTSALQELPSCRDIILETFVSGLATLEDVERTLSPDGFERSAMLSPVVNLVVLNARQSVFNVLLSNGTGAALAAAAKWTLKLGQNWKTLELIAHDYISFYTDLLDMGKKKQYPVPHELEVIRVIFLVSARAIFQRAIESTTPNVDSQRQHPESELRFLTAEIGAVSEYFKNRHAFRMPRTTRIAYLLFGCSLVNIVRHNHGTDSYRDRTGTEDSALLDMVRSIQKVLLKLLMDSEFLVRIVAAKVVPKMMSLNDVSEEDDIESVLKDSLPENADCEDFSDFYGLSSSKNPSGVDENTNKAWGLSTVEENAFHLTHESFQTLGAAAKGYSSLFAIAELALAREDLVPYCLTDIMTRVSGNQRLLVSGYHAIARLCAALDYRTPSHLYGSYARFVLPKWFEAPGSIDALYRFPASLLMDSDHHKEGVLYDWMRHEQKNLLPHILVQEKAMSLDLTARLAEALQEDLVTLLRKNIAAFSLLYPMQFTGGLHQRGKLLWQAIDTTLNGEAIGLMVQKKSEVIDAFLHSVSTNWTSPLISGRSESESSGGMGFSRDTRSLKPPCYDPLVIALAINHLFASDSNIFIVDRSVLRGSLFAEVRDERTGEVLADQFVAFMKECQRTNISLLRILISTTKFFQGSQSPQPARSRRDSFFCVGMLWRMLDDTMLIKQRNERVAFYKLIARGFQYEETVSDAIWLLSDVQTKLKNLERKYPNFNLSESDLGLEDDWGGHYLMSMTVSKERQMYELLSTVSPVLVSIIAKVNRKQSILRHMASRALHDLLHTCSEEQLWSTILYNGPYPMHKLFKDARKIYERARAFVEGDALGDTVETLLGSMARFRKVYRRVSTAENSVNVLACLQELQMLLDESTVNKLSKKIKSEAWLRSNGMEQLIIPQVNGTLSCIIDIIYKSSAWKPRGAGFQSLFAGGVHVAKDERQDKALEDSLLHEVARLLSVFGLLHSQSSSLAPADTYHKSIPVRQDLGHYEEVGSGIRHGLLLLQNLLHSDLPVQAQIALNALVGVLKTNDARRIYSQERSTFEGLASFKSADSATQASGLSSASFHDAVTGELLSSSGLPELRSTGLWSLSNRKLRGNSDLWMRKLCTVLARNCQSSALQALAPACFSAYKLSCEMLPYLLMDIICDLDDPGCSEVSKLLRQHILLNENAPVPILRAFVYALNVLCQIGLEVVSSKGILSWVRNMGQSHGFPYYYVLEVPYLEAAKAALRGQAYYSVIRFSQLYIDQKLARAELKQSVREGSGHRSERRYSSCPLRDPAVESAEQAAREKVSHLVREAMKQLGEPDGIRAFGENSSLSRSAASVAVLDRDWSRSLTALDVASNEIVPTANAFSDASHGTGQISNHNRKCWIDFGKEMDLFRSFIGLGTFNIATDYWDGLRNRVIRAGMPEESISTSAVDSCLSQLNDLRYAAAWKLGQWESPPMLPQADVRVVRNDNSTLGFHKTVYLTLRSLRTGRLSDIPEILSRSRKSVLRKLRDESSTVSAKSIFENACRLYVYYILERMAFLEFKPTAQVRNPAASRILHNENGANSSLPFSSQSYQGVRECDSLGIAGSLDRAISRDLKTEDIMQQILGNQYGVDDKAFNDGLMLARDAFHVGILADDLPVILARSLTDASIIAGVSATISTRVLAEGSVGAWPRATCSLGTEESSRLADAPRKDGIAWRLQETRLRYFANHDAPSKKQALAIVKDIISNDLGGKALDKTPSDVAESASFQQSLSWQRGDIDEETLGFLRSEACCMAAAWSLEMKTHEPMDIFQMYLESGLTAASNTSGGGQLVGRAHFAMATFADSQINNIDSYRKSRMYDEMVSAVKEMEQKISTLKKMKENRLSKNRSKAAKSRRSARSSRSEATSEVVTQKQIGRDLDLLIRTEQKKAGQDRDRLEKLDETYQKWQLLACKHFASSLCAGSSQDLRASFRMVALWLDARDMRTKITMALIDNTKRTAGEFRRIRVPVSKLLPLAPQLASRLNKSEGVGDAVFQEALSGTITEMAGDFPAHCLWQLLALSNATRDSGSQEKYSSLYRGDKDKKDAADEILGRLQHRHGDTVSEMKKMADAYILLSETKASRKSQGHLDLRGFNIMELGELSNVPVPTVPIPLQGTHLSEHIPHIKGFERRARVVKGKDDLRGDAVMEQMFTILNSLLEKDGEASKRSLHIRTYRIIPLSPFSGIMQFVSNTKQFRELLVDKDSGPGGKPRSSLHERYHPKDLKHDEMQRRAFHYHKQGGPQKVVQFLASAWQKFQPAFRFFFMEQWPDPAEWFSHQLCYSRSVAVMSMVGFILGLGDRHLSNILLDESTAEVVHIDFGIAFEQGKLLPTPEHMPFRLTRDLVDGFGIAGVEGVFRRCSEIALSVMRCNKDVMLTVIEVLLHDPMYSWALTPEEVLREQIKPQGSDEDEDYFASNDYPRSLGDSSLEAIARTVNKNVNGSREAQRALNRISEKLDGLEGTERLSVEAHVARLIDEACAFHVIAPVYPGWAPWL